MEWNKMAWDGMTYMEQHVWGGLEQGGMEWNGIDTNAMNSTETEQNGSAGI